MLEFLRYTNFVIIIIIIIVFVELRLVTGVRHIMNDDTIYHATVQGRTVVVIGGWVVY